MSAIYFLHNHEFLKAQINSAVKKKILAFVTVWMDLDNIMLREVNHSVKDKYHMISLICGI